MRWRIGWWRKKWTPCGASAELADAIHQPESQSLQLLWGKGHGVRRKRVRTQIAFATRMHFSKAIEQIGFHNQE
jgi:hypothetical protein